MKQINIKKVKVTKENKILMVYEKRSKSGNAWDEFMFTCSEEARPAFHIALSDLAQDVILMCELPKENLEKITVKSVSFSHSSGVMGAVITASMKLDRSHQGLNLNTPHKACEMYNADTPADEKQLLTGDCIERLEILLEECEAYIKGDRAQGSLFPEETIEESIHGHAEHLN